MCRSTDNLQCRLLHVRRSNIAPRDAEILTPELIVSLAIMHRVRPVGCQAGDKAIRLEATLERGASVAHMPRGVHRSAIPRDGARR